MVIRVGKQIPILVRVCNGGDGPPQAIVVLARPRGLHPVVGRHVEQGKQARCLYEINAKGQRKVSRKVVIDVTAAGRRSHRGPEPGDERLDPPRLVLSTRPIALTSLKSVAYGALVSAGGGGGPNWRLSVSAKGTTSEAA